MKSLYSSTMALVFTMVFSASYAQQLHFTSIQRTDGTAFFSLNDKSGQLSFMLDYGSSAGTWKNYGGTIRSTGGSTLLLSTISREDGTAFFSLDNATGQLYYMLDYGSSAGTWKSYGATLAGRSGANYQFTAIQRTDGTAFFAQDAQTGQMYYLLDYGSDPGNWKSYGGVIGE
ncbi:MAG: hypothetical protein A3D92_13660 [Bacteroidetes bacterium RIFCSPHIGHO2_02_FULL_44_7]|nr:MAG: hypothetical protein A3D92_13660 [Bacteroidetes bacterium RIFCSPHIGHO2_02_FULL_44_7]